MREVTKMMNFVSEKNIALVIIRVCDICIFVRMGRFLLRLDTNDILCLFYSNFPSNKRIFKDCKRYADFRYYSIRTKI